MFVPGALDARSSLQVGPQSCKPFSIHSNVCVGDLIAIVVCSIAGVGFFFWGIHAIRKMREPSPFDEEEDNEQPNGEDPRLDPFYIPYAFDEHGVPWKPNAAERVRIRLALSEPEEPFYRPPAPISTNAYDAQGAMTTPRMPPRAGGQSKRTSSRRSSRHASPIRDGAYGERYEYGVNDEYRTYGERHEYGVNDEYIRNVSPSRARGSPPHRPQSGHRSPQSMGRMNEDPIIYNGYAYY